MIVLKHRKAPDPENAKGSKWQGRGHESGPTFLERLE